MADKSLKYIPQFDTMPLAAAQDWSLVLKGPEGQLAALKVAGFTGGGGSGSLPTDAVGYLRNDGLGNLTWQSVSGGGGGAGLLDYYILEGTTNSAAETELFVDGLLNNRIPVPLNSAIHYQVDIVCRRTDAGRDAGAWCLKGLADNLLGNTLDQGLIYEERIAVTDPAFQVDVRANTLTDTINIYVTGASAKTISWRVHCQVLRTA